MVYDPASVILENFMSRSKPEGNEGFWNLVKVILGVLSVIALYLLVQRGAIS